MTITTLKSWTPKNAKRFCDARIERAHNALLEIAYTWGDVDETVVAECDQLVASLDRLRNRVAEATNHELGVPEEA